MHLHWNIYRKDFHKQFINIIPTNIYGPEDNFNLDTAHVIPALIHKAYLAKQNNTPFTVFGDGTPLRQFIYVDDVARICLWMLFFYKKFDNLILADNPESEISIGKIATIIQQEFSNNSEILYDTSYSNGQYKKTVSNQKLRECLPNFSFTPIEIGLSQTIQWFQQQYDICRK